MRLTTGIWTNLRYLARAGDGYDEIYEFTMNSVTVNRRTSIEKVDLGEGMFIFMFEMWDFQENHHLSDMVYFIIEDGEFFPGYFD